MACLWRNRSGCRKANEDAVRRRFREFGVPVLLLAAGVVTTTADGARFMQNFLDGAAPVVRDSDLWPWPWLVEHPELWPLGFYFSFTLLGILMVHEFGHYFACRAHRIKSTLPLLLPAPTLSGTAGAVIRIKSRIPDRNALLDVGLYGPLAGYVASGIAIAVGFTLSTVPAANAPNALVEFGGEPLTIQFLHWLMSSWDPSIPAFDQVAPHPVLVAGWIGLFITSLNLVPGGQLDGGHVLYAVSPRLHRLATNVVPFLLFLAGAVCWVGWILWGVFLLIPAMRHPRVGAEAELSAGRRVVAWLGLILFVLSFTPYPFANRGLMHFLHADPFTATPH